jgi:hypothetical protein
LEILKLIINIINNQLKKVLELLFFGNRSTLKALLGYSLRQKLLLLHLLEQSQKHR